MPLTELHQTLTRLADAGDFSGVVLIDGPDGTLLERGYGLASYTWQVPATPDIRYDTASITKLFTAVAVLQQVEAGAITLDTPVVDYLGLTGTAISPAATVHHMLCHTSGIGDDADEEAGEDYEAIYADRPNYSVRHTADLLEGFRDKPANFAPGEGCRYCNASYVLLGLVVERASGQAYRDYVAEHVFGPAGMTDSGFFAMDRVVPRVAEAVEPVDGDDEGGSAQGAVLRRNIYAYPPIGSPDGGAHVTARDLLTFHRALLAGRLLRPETVALMTGQRARHTDADGDVHWMGYGWESDTDDSGALRSYWKDGINVGASGAIRHYPGSGFTVVVLSNLTDGAWEPLSLLDTLVDELTADGAPAHEPVGGAQDAAVAGPASR